MLTAFFFRTLTLTGFYLSFDYIFFFVRFNGTTEKRIKPVLKEKTFPLQMENMGNSRRICLSPVTNGNWTGKKTHIHWIWCIKSAKFDCLLLDIVWTVFIFWLMSIRCLCAIVTIRLLTVCSFYVFRALSCMPNVLFTFTFTFHLLVNEKNLHWFRIKKKPTVFSFSMCSFANLEFNLFYSVKCI